MIKITKDLNKEIVKEILYKMIFKSEIVGIYVLENLEDLQKNKNEFVPQSYIDFVIGKGEKFDLIETMKEMGYKIFFDESGLIVVLKFDDMWCD